MFGIKGILIWVLLITLLVGAFWFMLWVVRACVQKGGPWRLLGILASFAIGGVCILVGYWSVGESITIQEATAMLGGGFIAVIGAGRALFKRKE